MLHRLAGATIQAANLNIIDILMGVGSMGMAIKKSKYTYSSSFKLKHYYLISIRLGEIKSTY